MENGSNSMNLPVPEMHMKMVGQVSSNPELQHFYVSTEHTSYVEPIAGNPGMNSLMISNNGVGQNGTSGILSGPIWVPDQLGHEFANVQNNVSGEKTSSLPVKRKAEVAPLVDNNKRPAHIGMDHNSLGFLQQRKNAPTQSKLSSPGPPAQHLQNKKMVRNDSISGKSGLHKGQVVKKQTAQIESASKVRSESSEGVRSKMRDSLAGALALAYQKQENVPTAEKNQSDAAIACQPVDSQASESNSTKEVSKTNDSQVFSAELTPNGINANGEQVFQDFQYGSSLPDESVSFGDTFFAKDDLLQGNGLSWAFEFDVQMGQQGKEAQHAEKPESVNEEAKEEAQVPSLTPENVAFGIESELFKLFGGVNKKYREKGRSLLFNLKDRNNPELRERVMSGEILPERLCSMSAEELASKELSEWRMAKAEELAQMKVLPDTEVDIRRLVRKTHKGEFQVEVEHDDGIAAEVSGGASVLTQHQAKKKTEPSPPDASLKDDEKVAGRENNNSEDQDFGGLIIPTDGTDETDLMQGMMVDELRDAEFLPPIVSLDEFMESLNNEPPFEDLPVDAAGQKTQTSHGESPKAGGNSRATSRALDSPKDAASKKSIDVKKKDLTMKSSGNPAKPKVLSPIVPKVEYMWDGILQLSLSSTVTVGGLFQSGEKTSTKEWPSSLEIKGRVRLDAFEKFLQDLPMSRTRAVMVLQFVLKDKSSDGERANLSEAIDSYSTDDRLGYAEPAPGVELYLCPPTSRMTEMLAKYMPKEHQRPDSNNPIEHGLIGVVVWRRAHISNTISPNSSSHHKHVSKKQQQPFNKRVHSSNVNPNSSTPNRTPQSFNKPQTEEDDDDIPPGFGPVAAAQAAKDDDDLPEFNFSGNMTPSVSRPNQNLQHGLKMVHRPVDEVRELIKKYGQSGASSTSSPISGRGFVDNNMKHIGIEPWNDDDDDIPEWRPQAPLQPHHHPNVVTHSHQPSEHLAPRMMAQPPPGGLSHPPPGGGRWAQPPGPPHGTRWRH